MGVRGEGEGGERVGCEWGEVVSVRWEREVCEWGGRGEKGSGV